MIPVVFVDLDGVIVDFVAGALRAHGKTLSPSEVTWGFPAQIGFTGVNDPRFWEVCGAHFWTHLGWTAEGKTLLTGIEEVFGADNVILMTSPCDTTGGVEGKVEWVRRNLPAYRRRFFVGPPKWSVAGPGKVLIDDHDGNCDPFTTAGGQALLVPRPWNSRRADTDGQGGFDVGRVLDELRDLAGEVRRDLSRL